MKQRENKIRLFLKNKISYLDKNKGNPNVSYRIIFLTKKSSLYKKKLSKN
jgi:hypothetical protein